VRIQGTLLPLKNAREAETSFREALKDAHRHGAMPSELRGAISLAGLLARPGPHGRRSR
jgi:hypothetical protein